MTMNTKDLAKDVAAKRGVTEKQALEVMAGLLEGIAEAAAKGEEISLPGFGKFKVKDTPEREARNPATGAMIKVAAAKKVTFTPAKSLKDALNK